MFHKRRYLAALLAALVILSTGGAEAGDNTLEAYCKDGLNLRSANGQHTLKLGGRIMNDWALFDDDAGEAVALQRLFYDAVHAQSAPGQHALRMLGSKAVRALDQLLGAHTEVEATVQPTNATAS